MADGPLVAPDWDEDADGSPMVVTKVHNLFLVTKVVRQSREREFFIDNLLVRNHFIILMIRRTDLAPWEFEFPFPGSLTSTFLGVSPPFGRVKLPRSSEYGTYKTVKAESGLGFQVKVLKTFKVVHFLLGSGFGGQQMRQAL